MRLQNERGPSEPPLDIPSMIAGDPHNLTRKCTREAKVAKPNVVIVCHKNVAWPHGTMGARVRKTSSCLLV